jgi:hypothetical protein
VDTSAQHDQELAVEARSSAACLRCGYSLATLPIDGVCPECGHAVRTSLEALGPVLPADSPVVCRKCKASLAGLRRFEQCRECRWTVNLSIVAYEQGILREAPLNTLKRLCVMTFWTMWVVVITAPSALPRLARGLGMRVDRLRQTEFPDVYRLTATFVCLVGAICLVVLIGRRPWQVAAILLAILALMGMCLPTLGSA